MAGTKLDTLPVELLSYICETIYNSHKPSLRPLTLVNKKCESIASSYFFRDICFSYSTLSEGYVRPDCEQWIEILTRRGCLESVRYIYVHGAFWPETPLRFCRSRQNVLDEAEWRDSFVGEFHMHEASTADWEEEIFGAFAELIVQLPYLDTLHWAAVDQVPDAVLKAISQLRSDFSLKMPEWRIRSSRDEMSPAQCALVTSPYLRSITARIVTGDVNRDILLRMLSGITPALREVRIVKCDTSNHLLEVEPSEDVPLVRLQDFYKRNQRRTKAKLSLFSIYGKDPVQKTDIEEWFHQADMSTLRCLELRSGVESEVWNSILSSNAHTMSCLKELVVGFASTCTREEQDEATEWIRGLQKVHKASLCRLEFCGNISRGLVDVAIKEHGSTLRRLALVPQAHSGLFTLKYIARDVEKIHQSCPLLEELTIPIKRGIAVGNKFHESQNYKALGCFSKLTHLHLILDNSRWGEMSDEWVLRDSQDADFESQEYTILDTRRITYGHVRYALINAATDENLARAIGNLITSRKAGVPLHELYIQPAGSMEIIRGFRPDDIPDLAPQLVDLYALLREVSRPYKLTRHIRDDVAEIVVREPPDSKPPFYWSQLPEEDRERQEVVCHPDGPEMNIFRRIWPTRPDSLSWRDDWSSFELPLP